MDPLQLLILLAIAGICGAFAELIVAFDTRGLVTVLVSIIVGIVGVETIYGQNMGSFRVIDALATLTFDFPAAHPRAEARQARGVGERACAVGAEQGRVDHGASPLCYAHAASLSCHIFTPPVGAAHHATKGSQQ